MPCPPFAVLNSSRRTSAAAARLALVALLVLGTGGAFGQSAPAQTLPPPAQTIYKVQMPDGSIVYTDNVPRGAKILDQRDASKAPQLTIPPPTAPRPSAPRAAASREPSRIDKATAEVEAAERDLEAAKEALQRGREQVEGDRIGLKGGGSRTSPEYEERVRRLELQVAAAEERLRKAFEARNAAR